MSRQGDSHPLRTIDWVDDHIRLIDQTLLPDQLVMLDVVTVEQLVDSISRLAVRGAPALGVAGGFGVALALSTVEPAGLHAAIDSIRHARPTAVNLARGVDRVAVLVSKGLDVVLDDAKLLRDDEITASTNMGDLGADLVEKLVGDGAVRAMTICNTGGLAAVERGTALAVIQTLHERRRLAEALPVETRPLLQGARLTTWELQRMGAPFRLLVDSAGPSVLARGLADVVLIGADRIAANGDTANKIGSYSLALGAARAGVPFIVVAPETTVDIATASGEEIEIEDRGPAEVRGIRGHLVTPPGIDALNPAFDVTPADLITAIVTDRRVVRLDRGDRLDPDSQLDPDNQLDRRPRA